MIDMREAIKARRHGEIRAAVALEITGDLSRVLAKFGLLSDASMLVEHDRETALGILTELLWKDMAYEDECMPHELAESIAHSVFDQYSEATSRYYSNGNWVLRESWNPLTEATFGAGIIITGTNKNYFCIWFEDED